MSAYTDRMNRNPPPVESWPSLVDEWSRRVFQDRHVDISPKIRALRLLEEAIELAQAEGVLAHEVELVRNQVFNKEPGDPRQELAGVLVCAAGVAATRGLPLGQVFYDEYLRIQTDEVISKVRHRNLAGDKIGFSRD